jgi:biopolymer transport protein ExbB/TolQ
MSIKKSVREKKSAEEPMPLPAPPGPKGFYFAHDHNALVALLLISLLAFSALSLGLSLHNTIELAGLKKTVRFVERLESKQVSALRATAETAASAQDSETLFDEADKLMDQAAALIEKAKSGNADEISLNTNQ